MVGLIRHQKPRAQLGNYRRVQTTIGCFNVSCLLRRALLRRQNDRLPPERWQFLGQLICPYDSRTPDPREVVADDEHAAQTSPADFSKHEGMSPRLNLRA